ncbi:MAG TPA: hypothetical protein VFQ37_16220 [Mycobacterium sp.]|nr:hypothetical protein [Mycobacterium sp.]
MLDDDLVSLPETEPHPAPVFDTGPHPQPLAASSIALAEPSDLDVSASEADTPPAHPRSVLAASVVVPSQYHFLKWWKLVLVLAAVWVPAAGVGVGLFSWWYSLVDKTPAVFVVLVYVVVCTVAGLLLAMVEGRPLVSALAIAVMTAAFGSMVAAAPLYGHYYCQVKSPCVAGIIPY